VGSIAATGVVISEVGFAKAKEDPTRCLGDCSNDAAGVVTLELTTNFSKAKDEPIQVDFHVPATFLLELYVVL